MEAGLSLDGGMLRRVPSTASKEEQAIALNDVIDRLNNLLKSQIFSDGSTKRYIQGFQKSGWPGGDFGMKISLPGIDVTTATADQLLFSWDYTTNNQYFYGGTARYFDPDSREDYAQIGILPDSSGGVVVAKPGESVDDAYTG